MRETSTLLSMSSQSGRIRSWGACHYCTLIRHKYSYICFFRDIVLIDRVVIVTAQRDLDGDERIVAERG